MFGNNKIKIRNENKITKHKNMKKWARGCIQQKRGANSQRTKAQPKPDFIFNLSSKFRTPCTKHEQPAYEL